MKSPISAWIAVFIIIICCLLAGCSFKTKEASNHTNTAAPTTSAQEEDENTDTTAAPSTPADAASTSAPNTSAAPDSSAAPTATPSDTPNPSEVASAKADVSRPSAQPGKRSGLGAAITWAINAEARPFIGIWHAKKDITGGYGARIWLQDTGRFVFAQDDTTTKQGLAAYGGTWRMQDGKLLLAIDTDLFRNGPDDHSLVRYETPREETMEAGMVQVKGDRLTVTLDGTAYWDAMGKDAEAMFGVYTISVAELGE